MSVQILILVIGFFGLSLMGVPLGASMLAATTAVLLYEGQTPFLLAQTMLSSTQSFSLLAVPFFILASEIMVSGGLSDRLLHISSTLVRHIRGGTGHIVILTAFVFAAISGSAPATTAAVGGIMIPAMAREGYSRGYATSLAVCAGVLAPLIPPSIAFILWGIIAQQSIPDLMLSGVMPGVSIALILGVYNYFYARRQQIPTRTKASLKEIAEALNSGKWALFAPVIVIGGIYGGVFTPTEASVASCVYSLFVGVLIERRLGLPELYQIVLKAMRTTGMLMFILMGAAGFGILVAEQQLPIKLATFLSESIAHTWVVMTVINLFLIVTGMVMDELALVIIFGPALTDIARQFGMDQIQFGSIVVTNIAISMATPPFGYCLFVGLAIARISMWQVAKEIWPMILLMFAVLGITTYVPAFSLLFVR